MVLHVCVFLFISIRLCIGQMRPPGCGRPVGDGWHLIRRSANSLIRTWHPATDNMAFTQEYNTDNILNNCVTDAQCAVELTASFSKSAASVLPGYDQVLYASGDCQYWLILNRTVTDIMSSYDGNPYIYGSYDFVRTSMKSQYECTYDVRNDNNFRYTIGGHNSFPKITGHSASRTFAFYIEASDNGDLEPFIYNNGMNVWIRNAEAVNDLKDCYPSVSPTLKPSKAPSIPPTEVPSLVPSITPTISPSLLPTITPTMQPSLKPTEIPSSNPSKMTDTPSMLPSNTPTKSSINPTKSPSQIPSKIPTKSPSQMPSKIPTQMPSNMPSIGPTPFISVTPTQSPIHDDRLTPIMPGNNFSDTQSNHILSYFVYVFIGFVVIFLD